MEWSLTEYEDKEAVLAECTCFLHKEFFFFIYISTFACCHLDNECETGWKNKAEVKKAQIEFWNGIIYSFILPFFD